MAKKTDLTEKNVSELKELLAEKREHLRSMRFGAIGAKIKDTNEPKKVRADIARILTKLHGRLRAGARENETAAEAAA